MVALAALRRLRDGRLVWNAVDWGVAGWATAAVASAMVFVAREGRLDAAVLRDVATTFYLAVLYLSVRVVADDAILEEAPGALVVSATVAAGLGVIGFGLSELGFDTRLAFAADAAYPYLGHAARARALTAHPNMLASILALALVLLFARATPRLGGGLRRLTAAVLLLGLALTFSKTTVALAAGLIVVWALRRGRGSRLLRTGVTSVWLAAAALFAAFSHFVILRGDAERARLEEAAIIAGDSLQSFDLAGSRYAVHPTNYFFNKRASQIAIERSWPWGIGPGRHPAFAGTLQREGLYPRTQLLGAPHSSYTGAAAELGLAGVLGLAAFLGGLSLGIRDALRRDATRPLGVAAAAVLAALLIEAIATDVMHFRHYTWLAALVGSAAARSRS